jgi:hypothetical protein
MPLGELEPMVPPFCLSKVIGVLALALQSASRFYLTTLSVVQAITGKAIPVTDRGGLQGCEKSRPPYFLDNRLTDGG